MGNNGRKKTFKCDQCDYFAYKKYNLDRHIRLKHDEFKFKCSHCPFKTKRRYLLYKHLNRHHKKNTTEDRQSQFSCYICKINFESRDQFDQHLKDSHPYENDFVLLNSAFDGQVREYSRNLRLEASDATALKSIQSEFTTLCQNVILNDFAMFSLNIIM